MGERSFLGFKAEEDGVLESEQVTAFRTKLGLNQRAAGKWLGGGPRSFQKYEAGTQTLRALMSNLLRLLAHDPCPSARGVFNSRKTLCGCTTPVGMRLPNRQPKDGDASVSTSEGSPHFPEPTNGELGKRWGRSDQRFTRRSEGKSMQPKAIS